MTLVRSWGAVGAWLMVASMAILGCGDDDDAGTSDGGADGGRVDAPPPFAGLSADVEIVVDDRGIPHIYGQSDEDAFYGAGYAMARNRLFQMDLLRRRALGRWSEVLGAVHQADDEISRLFNFRDLGAQDVAILETEAPEAHGLLVAWTAGINRFIGEVRSGQAPLPYGFGPTELDFVPEYWTPQELVAVSRIAFFSTANTLEAELLASVLRRYFPAAYDAIELVRPFSDVTAVPSSEAPTRLSSRRTPLRGPSPGPAAAAPALPADFAQQLATLRERLRPYRLVGSNNWAVAGEHTASGRPMLANDPHLMMEVPNVMMPLHIHSKDGGGTFDVAGFTLAGSVGISLGHNDRIAWSATTTFGDVMDVWDVPVVGASVRLGDETLPIVNRTERIVVRGEGMPAGEGLEVQYLVQEVPGKGVLLPQGLVPLPLTDGGRRLLLGYTGFAPLRGADSLLRLQRAASMDDFERAIDGVIGLGFNLVAADAQSIAYRVGLAIPDRGVPSASRLPYLVMDGEDSASLWSGAFLPPERLPRSRDPEQGYIATANNDPFGFTADGDVTNDPWYYGGLFAPGFRAQRVNAELQRLTARGDLTPDDMRTLQLDCHSELAAALLPLLADAVAAIDSDPRLEAYRGKPQLAELAALLEGWDRQMRRASSAALVFRAWMFHAAQRLLEDDVSVLFREALALPVGAYSVLKFAALTLLDRYPRGDALLGDATREEILVGALDETAVWLTERFGGVGAGLYSYGDLHGFVFEHDVGGAYDVGFVSADGGDDTINHATATFYDGAARAERWESRFGGVFRMVTTFDDDGVPVAEINYPLGVSGDPTSANFQDGLSDYIEGRYVRLPFRRAEVMAARRDTWLVSAEGSVVP